MFDFQIGSLYYLVSLTWPYTAYIQSNLHEITTIWITLSPPSIQLPPLHCQALQIPAALQPQLWPLPQLCRTAITLAFCIPLSKLSQSWEIMRHTSWIHFSQRQQSGGTCWSLLENSSLKYCVQFYSCLYISKRIIWYQLFPPSRSEAEVIIFF